jgi:cytosine/adenosine deaminase-related metal-dependent hydrolase
VAEGLRECREHGTVAVGEISTADDADPVYAANRPRCVVFRELLGLSPERTAEQMRLAVAHLDAAPTGAKSRVVRGLSPHAPYSVRPELFRQAVSLAAAYRAPVAVHLAETTAERELLERGTGELAEMLREFGVWHDGLFPGEPLVESLKTLAAAPRGLVVHGNYLTDEETDFLAGCPHLTVVYCPRTHGYFGHSTHPWRELLRRGVRVALGTDSRASNPDLDLWREAVFLHRLHPDVPPAEVLRMATVAGETALFGTAASGLTGRRADELTLVDLPAVSDTDPYRLLLHPASRARQSRDR